MKIFVEQVVRGYEGFQWLKRSFELQKNSKDFGFKNSIFQIPTKIYNLKIFRFNTWYILQKIKVKFGIFFDIFHLFKPSQAKSITPFLSKCQASAIAKKYRWEEFPSILHSSSYAERKFSSSSSSSSSSSRRHTYGLLL